MIVAVDEHLQGFQSNQRLVRPRLLPAEGSPTWSELGGPSGERLSVWLLGTGTPAVLENRAGPSNLVRCGQDVIVVDCGNCTGYQLDRLGVTPADISHIFITHHHIDHNTDLPFLLISPWVGSLGDGYQAPHIIGPPGTLTFVERLLALHEYDLRVRMPHGYNPQELAAAVTEVEDGSVVAGADWQAIAFRVDHDPVGQAFGYRFEDGVQSVAFSGDTRPCDNLIEYATDVDLLVHEVLYPGFGIPEYHTPSHEVGKVAARANAKRLALTHLLPGNLPDEAWLEHVHTDYPGPTIVGSDLLRLL